MERNTKSISEGISLKAVNCVRLLGVDQSLSFKGHISKNCNKTDRQLNALSRPSHILSSEANLTLVRSFIVSNFKFALICGIFCGISDMKKIEKIHERA